jgi:long-chain acyl-CoA synthetase
VPGPATPRSSRRSAAAPEAEAPPAAGPATYADRPWLAHYPDGVPADFDFPKVPLTRLLDDAASSWPSATALVFFGTKLTYKELKDVVDRFATGLAGLGVKKGDRVAVVLPNCPQNVIATYAALRLGAVVVQHNPLYTEHELRHQLADCGATVVVCLDRVYESVARVRRDTAVQHVVVTSIVDYLSTSEKLRLMVPLKKAKRAKAEISATIPKGAPVKQFLALLKGAGLPSRQVPIDAENDLALLQYTGGTTGLSKGAMLTHANLVSNAYMNRLWDTGATPGKEVCLAVLPLFHAYGLTVCMNATLLLGGTLVLLPRFDLDRVFAAIDQWKPTMFPGVPPIYKAISDSPKAKSTDLRSIRVCVSGAMKLPGEIQEQFERISGARLVEGYGMTETSPSTHCNPITGLRKTGSIGVPLPGTACKIVDAEDSTREVPPGEAGELAIRGPQVFKGYWGRDGAPADSGVFTDDGYVLTGDIAVMDDDGFFAVVDRKKELIIAGGFNIYPSEVEEVLFGLDGVADAVVVGVPDRYRGETVKAFVVAAPGATLTADDVVAHCATELSAYKVPKVVEFRDALPRTEVGKVLRRVLVEEEAARLAEATSAQPGSVPSSIAARRREEKDARDAGRPAAEPAAEDAAATEAPAKRAAAGGAAKRGVKKAAKVAAAEKTATTASRTAASPKAPAKKAAAKKPGAKKPAAKAPAAKKAAPRPAAPGAPVEATEARQAAVKKSAAKASAAKKTAAPRKTTGDGGRSD